MTRSSMTVMLIFACRQGDQSLGELPWDIAHTALPARKRLQPKEADPIPGWTYRLACCNRPSSQRESSRAEGPGRSAPSLQPTSWFISSHRQKQSEKPRNLPSEGLVWRAKSVSLGCGLSSSGAQSAYCWHGCRVSARKARRAPALYRRNPCVARHSFSSPEVFIRGHCHTSLTQSSAVGLEWSLSSILEHVLYHLDCCDVAKLRLVSRAFRSHPAVLQGRSKAKTPYMPSIQECQTGLRFWARMPKLQEVYLGGIPTLFGLHNVTQLVTVHLASPPISLDLYPLAHLPRLRSLCIYSFASREMINLQELTLLTKLRLSDGGHDCRLSSLTGLKHLSFTDTSPANLLNASEHVGLQGWLHLTGLTYLGGGKDAVDDWQQLPLLQCLSVTLFDRLGTLEQATKLRALGLNLSYMGPVPSLAPLSSLRSLERLDLFGKAVPIPPLASLTRLTIHYTMPGTFPDITGLPLLEELQLKPFGDLYLPILTDMLNLEGIYYQEGSGEVLRNCKCCVPCQWHEVDKLDELDAYWDE